jgi:predicted permease
MDDWRGSIRKRLAGLRIDPVRLEDIVSELAQHAEDRYNELTAEGIAPSEAEQAVMAELEDTRRIEEAVAPQHPAHVIPAPGAAPSGNRFADFIRDLRYGLRAMGKNPMFALFAVLTLSLGIGANTTVFTVVNTLLLHPLPVADPSSLVGIFGVKTKGSKQANAHVPHSYPDFHDYETQNTVFSGLAGFTGPMMLTLDQPAGPGRIFGQMVTSGYFDTLGIKPAAGRFFLPHENVKPGSAPVAVLSYGAWHGRFSGDPSVLGRSLTINKVAFTIVGVAPKGFLGVSATFGPDVWMPATMSHLVIDPSSSDPFTNRSETPLQSIGRLKPGITRAQAESDLQAIAAALRSAHPATNETRSVAVGTLSEEMLADMSGQISLGSGVLMAIVGLVLAIACSNVANLLLARAAARRQEVAVRLALGASRSRLIRQSLTESLLLGLLSCAVGLAMGYEGCQLLWSLLPAEYTMNLFKPRLDFTVFAFALAISLLTTLLFGLVPALRSSNTDVATGLKEESRSGTRSRRNISFTNALLVGQMAFSLVALVTATLCFRSIERAYAIDPGFGTRNLAIFMLAPQAGYDHARVRSFYRETRRRVEALPGVRSVTWASGLPFWNMPTHPVEVEAAETVKPSERPLAVLTTVDIGYFETMRIPVLQGRAFNQGDRVDSTPVAIINQDLTEKYWAGRNALGRQFRFEGEKQFRTVVGIARTSNYSRLGEAPQPCVYIPLEQNFFGGMMLYVQADGDPASVASSIQRELYNIDANVPVIDVRTGSKLIDQVLFTPRVGVMLLSVFGGLALILASVGLYGLVSYSVNQRHKELGLRVALGATTGQIVGLVVREGMKFVITGLVLGLAVSILLSRVLSRMLFEISGLDPPSITAASAILLGVALIACYLPGRTAARLDSQRALRET